MICQCGYVGEVSLSMKLQFYNLFQICPFDEASFFRNLFMENCVLSMSTLERCRDANEATITHVP